MEYPDKINFNVNEFFFSFIQQLVLLLENVRLQSLIENLVEYKESNWVTIAQNSSLSKSKEEI